MVESEIMNFKKCHPESRESGMKDLVMFRTGFFTVFRMTVTI
ncbi:MAG: hypothetical protein UX98_C0005G0040 [Parcubacteria group bacterium GW2011_GWA2_47_26]|nr:MAG: hypothetical protein UX98_C0005G0040 [Parcubacteria group bacterium GW2011_GWA2_47_26]